MDKMNKMRARGKGTGNYDIGSETGKRKLDKMLETTTKWNNNHVSVYAAKKTSSRNIQNIHRMLNVMRKKRTLARAAIPRSHRNFHHTDENFVIHPMLAKKKKNIHAKGQFFRAKPEVHYQQFRMKKKRDIRELQILYNECVATVGADEDEEQTKDLVEESEKMKVLIMDAKNLLDLFEQNYSFFLATSVSSRIQAEAMDAKYKKEAKDKLTSQREHKERAEMTGEDLEKHKQYVVAIGEECDASKKKITDFFRPVVGKWKQRTEKYYHDFYHDVLVGASTRVDTPAFKETPMFKKTLPVSRLEQLNNKMNTTCPHCGSSDLVTDTKTTEAGCKNCGVTRAGPNKYQQSFAEAQASSTRNTAPYERVSHVSIYIPLVIF